MTTTRVITTADLNDAALDLLHFLEWVAKPGVHIKDDTGQTFSRAAFICETLTDGSEVFNIVLAGEVRAMNIDPDLAFDTPDGLRSWVQAMTNTDLAAEISNWERKQCEAGAGKSRAYANRRLGYLRREAKRRGW